jgi:hypothetical protein
MTTPVKPTKFEAPIGTTEPGNVPHAAATNSTVAPQDVNVPKPKVSPNVIQPSPTPIGPNSPAAHIRVKNVHINALNLEAGIIEPGQTGFATDAEVSNLRGQYLEVA